MKIVCVCVCVCDVLVHDAEGSNKYTETGAASCALYLNTTVRFGCQHKKGELNSFRILCTVLANSI